MYCQRLTLLRQFCIERKIAMSEKFDPAPFDKYSEPAPRAIKADREMDAKLKARLIGGSFPASDPSSAVQPSPSKYDEKED
jgi:hypothetical protein